MTVSYDCTSLQVCTVHCALQLLQSSCHCVRAAAQGMVVVENAMVKSRTSREQLMRIVKAGMEKRVVSSTAMNKESSRSHMIISIVIESVDKKTQSTEHGQGALLLPFPTSLASVAAT